MFDATVAPYQSNRENSAKQILLRLSQLHKAPREPPSKQSHSQYAIARGDPLTGTRSLNSRAGAAWRVIESKLSLMKHEIKWIKMATKRTNHKPSVGPARRRELAAVKSFTR